MRTLWIAALLAAAAWAQPAPSADAPLARNPNIPPPSVEPSAESQELVSGAPLRDPNVAVHVVQRKPLAERGRSEVSLYPVAYQVNGKFTDHVGTALTYVYHLHENFGLQIMGQYDWYNTESKFNEELINKVREEAQAATSLLLNWGAVAGVEVTPLYGKFAFYQGTLGQFMVVINGGAGVGSTRHELRPPANGNPGTYGDTGYKLLGEVGGGVRIQLGDHFALRLELRDLVYTARVDRVNGCGVDDLNAMYARVQSGQTNLNGVSVGGSCQIGKFDGTDSRSGDWRGFDVPPALSLVSTPSSDALNNLSFYAGLSYIF